MNSETLDALKASIRKWRENAAARTPEQVSIGMGSCALCRMFHPAYKASWENMCDGCPIAGKTGKTGCEGTPYDDAVDALDRWEWRESGAAEFRRIACEEVAFLESLLPEGEAA